MAGSLLGLYPGILNQLYVLGYDPIPAACKGAHILSKAHPGALTSVIAFLTMFIIHCSFVISGILSKSKKRYNFIYFLKEHMHYLLPFIGLALSLIFLIWITPPVSRCEGFGQIGIPLESGSTAIHSDVWAIMLFVAIFVLYLLCSALSGLDSKVAPKSYKVKHNSLIKI